MFGMSVPVIPVMRLNGALVAGMRQKRARGCNRGADLTRLELSAAPWAIRSGSFGDCNAFIFPAVWKLNT
ncbi:hypothetical protein EV560_108115 [Bosea sp. BK604]|nr:hypothetical protein EV560_108115 [Bosea sp. BK604]